MWIGVECFEISRRIMSTLYGELGGKIPTLLVLESVHFDEGVKRR